MEEKRLNIKLDEEEHRELKVLAASTGRTVQQTVVDAIREHVRKHREKEKGR